LMGQLDGLIGRWLRQSGRSWASGLIKMVGRRIRLVVQSGREKPHGYGLVASQTPAFSGPRPTAKAPGDQWTEYCIANCMPCLPCSGDTWTIRACGVDCALCRIFTFWCLTSRYLYILYRRNTMLLLLY
jgi:hypothetical protein